MRVTFYDIDYLKIGTIMSELNIFSNLYEKFGQNIQFELLTKKDDKVVYHIKTETGDFILIVLPDLSAVQFYKYMSSQGLQQRLFEAGLPVAKIVYAYREGRTVVLVHQKLAGVNTFVRTPENMEKMGKLAAQLHLMTSSVQYKKERLLFTYPNFAVRWLMTAREWWRMHISYSLRYYKLRKLPAGVCHRDFNQRNIFMADNGEMGIIDFDVHRYQPLVEGIVRFYQRKIKNQTLFADFMRGYMRVRPLTDDEKKYLKQKINVTL